MIGPSARFRRIPLSLCNTRHGTICGILHPKIGCSEARMKSASDFCNVHSQININYCDLASCVRAAQHER